MEEARSGNLSKSNWDVQRYSLWQRNKFFVIARGQWESMCFPVRPAFAFPMRSGVKKQLQIGTDVAQNGR